MKNLSDEKNDSRKIDFKKDANSKLNIRDYITSLDDINFTNNLSEKLEFKVKETNKEFMDYEKFWTIVLPSLKENSVNGYLDNIEEFIENNLDIFKKISETLSDDDVGELFFILQPTLILIENFSGDPQEETIIKNIFNTVFKFFNNPKNRKIILNENIDDATLNDFSFRLFHIYEKINIITVESEKKNFETEKNFIRMLSIALSVLLIYGLTRLNEDDEIIQGIKNIFEDRQFNYKFGNDIIKRYDKQIEKITLLPVDLTDYAHENIRMYLKANWEIHHTQKNIDLYFKESQKIISTRAIASFSYAKYLMQKNLVTESISNYILFLEYSDELIQNQSHFKNLIINPKEAKEFLWDESTKITKFIGQSKNLFDTITEIIKNNMQKNDLLKLLLIKIYVDFGDVNTACELSKDLITKTKFLGDNFEYILTPFLLTKDINHVSHCLEKLNLQKYYQIFSRELLEYVLETRDLSILNISEKYILENYNTESQPSLFPEMESINQSLFGIFFYEKKDFIKSFFCILNAFSFAAITTGNYKEFDYLSHPYLLEILKNLINDMNVDKIKKVIGITKN